LLRVALVPVLAHGAGMPPLLGVPAAADTEFEASPREGIQARHGLRGGDGVPLDDETDARADAELRGHRGRRHQRDEGVEGVRVLPWQLTPAGEGRAAAHRDVRMLGDEERLEAAGLDLARALVHADLAAAGGDANA